MIDDFDIDFNINEDDEEVDVYETSMEDLQYELYIEKQDGIDSLLDDSLHNNLKPFEKTILTNASSSMKRTLIIMGLTI